MKGHFKKCKEHTPPPSQKWGIAGSKKWCNQCKKFIELEIDFTGHP